MRIRNTPARMTGIIVISIVVLIALFLLNSDARVHAQETDIGQHCPTIAYAGNRPEWDKPFQTNGMSGRVVHFAGTPQVQVEDWCQTTGQGLVPPYVAQLIWRYQDLSTPTEGDPVSFTLKIDFATGQIIEKKVLSIAKPLPKLSGSMMYYKIEASGLWTYAALRFAEVGKETYLQLPDGLIGQVID